MKDINKRKSFLTTPQFLRPLLLMLLLILELLIIGDLAEFIKLMNKTDCCQVSPFFTEGLVYPLIILAVYLLLLVVKKGKISYVASFAIAGLSFVLFVGLLNGTIRSYKLTQLKAVLIDPKNFWNEEDSLKYDVNKTLPSKEIAEAFFLIKGEKFLYLDEEKNLKQFEPAQKDSDERSLRLMASNLHTKSFILRIIQCILILSFLLLTIRFSYRNPTGKKDYEKIYNNT